MRGLFALIGLVALILVGAISLGLVHVQQTREARLPDANGKGGQAPAFKAEVAKLSVGSEQRTMNVTVPAIKVDKPAGTTTTAPANSAESSGSHN